MKKLLASLTTTAAPVLIVLLTTVSVPSICLILFLINPFLILLCIGPFAGLLPPDFTTFL